MSLAPSPSAALTSPAWSSTRFALWTAASAWTLYLAVALVRCVIYGVPHPAWVMQRHAMTALAAIVASWLIHLLLSRLEQRRMRDRLAAALLVTVPAAAVLSVINYNVMFVFAPASYLREMGFDLHLNLAGEVLHSMIENYFVFSAWAVLGTAVSQAVQTRDVLRRAADIEASARKAELRALRLQLDPHFLFNALNTVSGLIVSGRTQAAEETVGALSSFLRASLSADASADVSLADEVRLQQLYLRIEQVRFGERLDVAWEVPEELEAAAVPALILQPLVENSIRHAVAHTSRPVRVCIRAWAEAAILHLSIEDDGPGGKGEGGHGLGLSNVAQRLRLRYEGAASCDHRRLSSGITRTALALPLVIGRATSGGRA